MSYKKLGDYIQQVNNRNRDLEVETLLGVSNTKNLIPSIANTIGTDMSKYKILEKRQFAYGTVTSRNGDRLSIGFLTEYEKALVSQIYIVFEVIDETKLLPEYLMMWFSRPEFDRYARFHSHGSTRETFDWEDMCEVELPVPSIEKQREIVAQYQAVANKIKVNEQICEKLEATAQTLYKQWFVDFEFPCLPSGYRPHGQVNQNLPIDEYITKIGSVCTYSRVGGLPVSDGKTWFVYLILCENDSVYKGITNDLYRRFYEHYMGEGAEWTKLNKPLKVIHWESFATKEEAAKREKDLKTGYGRTWISRQIEKADGITQLKTSLPAPQTELRTAGKMVYNQELEKEIPEGWEVKRLEDIYIIQIGRTPPRDEPKWFNNSEDENINWISIKDINENGNYILSTNESLSLEAYKTFKIPLIPKNTVVLSFKMSVGKLSITNINSLSNEAIASFIENENNYLSNKYLYLYLKGFNYKSLGTTSSIVNSINSSMIKEFKIIIPIKEVNNNFSNYIEDIYTNIKIGEIQNQKLTQLQSLLLSRLATLEG